MEKQLLLFGLMKKAGRLSVGDEPVTDALTFGDARVAALASDAAENTVRRFERLAGEVNVPVVHLKATKRELGESLGRATAAVVAVCDIGFAARFLELACEAEPENAELAAAREKMTYKAERLVEERKKKRKEEKEAQKHPFRARAQAPKAEEAPQKAVKGKQETSVYEKKDGDVRTYVPAHNPGKVYGKAPGRARTSTSIGDRRREDAEKKYGKSEYDRGYRSSGSEHKGPGAYNKQGSRGTQRTGTYKSGSYKAGNRNTRQDAHGKGGKTK